MNQPEKSIGFPFDRNKIEKITNVGVMEKYYEYIVIIKERAKDTDIKNIYAITERKQELTEQSLKEDIIELHGDDVVFLSIRIKEISLKKFLELENEIH